MVVVSDLYDAECPTSFCQEDLKVKKVPDVLHEAHKILLGPKSA